MSSSPSTEPAAPNARVLVIGAAGQLGSALMAAFADDAAGVDHGRLDLEDPSGVATLLARSRPEVVVNTAAFHNVEQCERLPERAFAINALAVDRLAGLCTQAGARLVHLSTDYVFSGEASTPYREDAAAEPANAYGASKIAGEHLLRRHGDGHVVIRTSGLYGTGSTSVGKGGSFAERILRQARAGERIRVVDDTETTPSNTAHVAAAIRAIVDRGLGGRFHVTNGGSCSWHAFATELLRQAGLPAAVEAVSSATFPSLARRPRYSVLAHAAMTASGLPPMPGWQEGITTYLASERNRL